MYVCKVIDKVICSLSFMRECIYLINLIHAELNSRNYIGLNFHKYYGNMLGLGGSIEFVDELKLAVAEIRLEWLIRGNS